MDPSGVMSMIGKNSKTDNIPQKLETAAKEKEKGNQFFAAQDNSNALYHYNCAMMYVKVLIGATPEETKKAEAIKVAVLNNMATVHLKLNRFTKCVSCCDQVLQIESNNIKALFRRGKAHLALNDLDRAESDLNKAAELDPNDKMIQRELLVLKKKNKEQDKKQQKFYSNLFERMSKENDEDKDLQSINTKEAPAPNKDEYVGMEDS
eukprot:TRINITY_DN3152_c0_g1_i1.p1 TRINITY_DN3152_c0_g1~~TRINITY_DN3152_c0_g1_i1.p1  ORF type:complete len:207 (+),score=76.77 TRINITY_DN3152_c0_g1_i1:117-737(+)